MQLSTKAARGYKYTGSHVCLKGHEDGLINREAGAFWREMNMRSVINSAVAEVEARWSSGKLKWNYKSVRESLPVYPKRGQLDVIRPGQEDDASPDPDGVPWELPTTTANDGAEDVEDEPGDLAEGVEKKL